MFYGTALLWIGMKRSNWYRLTSNAGLKLMGMLYCDHRMSSLEERHRNFFLKRVFENHKRWEDVIGKYGINTENVVRLK